MCIVGLLTLARLYPFLIDFSFGFLGPNRIEAMHITRFLNPADRSHGILKIDHKIGFGINLETKGKRFGENMKRLKLEDFEEMMHRGRGEGCWEHDEIENRKRMMIE